MQRILKIIIEEDSYIVLFYSPNDYSIHAEDPKK